MSTGLRFTLEVDGLPPDAFAVVSFHLNQSLSSLFSKYRPEPGAVRHSPPSARIF
ncbi:hypothetical protein [Escherichia coli]|uniref:hypothetical protein n=1 Tax=Escherichia coli TaxID=562 RepID=UPI003860292C